MQKSNSIDSKASATADKRAHVHSFTRSKPTATVETCACGKFRHTENAGPAIAGVETVERKPELREENEIILHQDGNTYIGPIATKFSYGRLTLPKIFKLSDGDKFHVFEVDGDQVTLRASQSSKDGALQYMGENRVLVYHESGDFHLPGIVAYARDLSKKTYAYLRRVQVTNPITIEQFGPWRWLVWHESMGDSEQICRDEESARKHFIGWKLHGTSA